MPISRANDLASGVCLVVHSSIVDRESANWVAACADRCVPYSSYGRVVFRAAPADRFAQLQRPKSHRRYLSSRSLSPAGSIEVSFAPGVIVRHAPTPHAIAPRRTARRLSPSHGNTSPEVAEKNFSISDSMKARNRIPQVSPTYVNSLTRAMNRNMLFPGDEKPRRFPYLRMKRNMCA
jgi:hypothetical protein